jgi:hypothetical protein
VKVFPHIAQVADGDVEIDETGRFSFLPCPIFCTSELLIFNFAMVLPALSVAALSEFRGVLQATSDSWNNILALIPFRRHF